MPDQATIERPARMPSREGSNHKRGFAELTNDLLHLTELQLDLMQVDARDFMKSSFVPLILMASAALLLLGCVPAGILMIVWAITDGGTTNILTASVIVFGGGLALIAGLGTAGYLLFRKSWTIPKRSYYEFKRNISWTRESLKHHINSEF